MDLNKNQLEDYNLIKKSDLFDDNFYLTEYQDIKKAQIDPLYHWIKVGVNENRRPNFYFDTTYYKKNNNDVVKSYMNPLKHWILYGCNEGRFPNEFFDPVYYIKSNPNLFQLNINPLKHWIKFGLYEGKIPNDDVFFYEKYKVPKRDNLLILISHNIGGGLSQYVANLLNICIDKYNLLNDFNIFTNETHYFSNHNIYFFNNYSITTISKNLNRVGSIYKKLVMFLNIIPNYINLSINDIIYFIDFLKLIKINMNNLDLYITIHDFFWIYPKAVNLLDNESDLSKEISIISSTNNLFSVATKIIFPTWSLFNTYKSFGLNPNINFEIIPHNDIFYLEIPEYYPNIKNKSIKLIFSGLKTKNNHKGLNSLLNILSEFDILISKNFNYNLTLYILGNELPINNKYKNIKIINYGNYDNNKIFQIINKLEPTLCLLMSRYETWSYMLSIYLKTGLPLFFNNTGAYRERIEALNRHNIASFNYKKDSNSDIAKKLLNFINKIITNNNHDFFSINENYNIINNKFYDRIFNNDITIKSYPLFLLICDINKFCVFRDYCHSITRYFFINNIRVKIILFNNLDHLIQQLNLINCLNSWIFFLSDIFDKIFKLFKFNKIFYINTEQLSRELIKTKIIDIFKKYNFIYLDYSNANLNIFKKLIPNIKSIYLPYLPNLDEIYNYEKTISCSILGCRDRRMKILNELLSKNINCCNFNGLWGIDRDNLIFKSKILVNVHIENDFNIFEELRCIRCIFNKIIIISEDSLSQFEHPLSKFIIFTKYDNIVKKTIEVLDNYDIYFSKIFNNFNISSLESDLLNYYSSLFNL